MKVFNRHPFLKAEGSSSGGASVAVGGSDAAPFSNAGPVSDGNHPMDARAADVFADDSDDDIGAAMSKGSSETSRGKEGSEEQQTSFFDEDFDPSTLEAPLQGKYREMESAWQERMQQIPDAEVMGLLGNKAEAFDRLTQMPEFQAWAEQITGSEGESPGSRAASDAAGLLEGLDEDVQQGIQNLVRTSVEQAIAERVTPIADAFYADKSQATISSLQQKYGEESFNRLAPKMQSLMESNEGLDVEAAYKLASYDDLQRQVAQRSQETAQKKFHANMNEDGSVGTEPALKRNIKTPADATRLAFEMVKMGHPDAFDPTRLPPGYRGE